MRLRGGFRLIFTPQHDPWSRKTDGGPDSVRDHSHPGRPPWIPDSPSDQRVRTGQGVTAGGQAPRPWLRSARLTPSSHRFCCQASQDRERSSRAAAIGARDGPAARVRARHAPPSGWNGRPASRSLARQTRKRKLVAGGDWARQFRLTTWRCSSLGVWGRPSSRAGCRSAAQCPASRPPTPGGSGIRAEWPSGAPHADTTSWARSRLAAREETEAQTVDCAPSTRRVPLAVSPPRSLTREGPATFQPRLTEALRRRGRGARLGARTLRVRRSPARPDGSASAGPGQLSPRGKSDDQGVFSVFPSAHVLLHPKRAEFVEGVDQDTPAEREASRIASDPSSRRGTNALANPPSVERITSARN